MYAVVLFRFHTGLCMSPNDPLNAAPTGAGDPAFGRNKVLGRYMVMLCYIGLFED